MLVVAAGVAFVIWSLAAENRELSAEITDLYAQLSSLQETTALQISIADGDTIPDTPVVGLAGETAELADLVSRGGVIAFLTTTCPYCKEMLPAWGELSREYAERGVPFVGVMLNTLEDTQQYVTEHDVDFPLWAPADPAAVGFAVAVVPYTVLVEPGGVIGGVWEGVLEESEITVVSAALNDGVFETQQMLSGSSAGDPGDGLDTAPDTDAASGQ